MVELSHQEHYSVDLNWDTIRLLDQNMLDVGSQPCVWLILWLDLLMVWSR